MKKTNQNLEQLNVKPAAFDDLLNLLDQGIISGKQLKMIVPKLVNLTTSVEQLIETMNIKLISDEATINAWIKQIQAANPNLDQAYQNKPEATIKFVVGEIMKISKGQANPVLSVKLVTRLLTKTNAA